MQSSSYFNKSFVFGIVSCLLIGSCRKEKLILSEKDRLTSQELSAPNNEESRIFESVTLKAEPNNTGFSFRCKYTKDKIKSLSKILIEIEINEEWYKLSSELKKNTGSSFKISAGETLSKLITEGKTYTLYISVYDSDGKQTGKTETFSVVAKEKKIKIKDHIIWSQGHDHKKGDNYGHMRVYFSLPNSYTTSYEKLLKSGNMVLAFEGKIQYSKSVSSSKSSNISQKFIVSDIQENDNGQWYTDIRFDEKNSWEKGSIDGTLILYDDEGELEDEKTISEEKIDEFLYDKKESPDYISSGIYSTDKGANWVFEMIIADRGGWGDSVIWQFDNPIKKQIGLTYSGNDKYGNEIFKATLNSKSDNLKPEAGISYSFGTLILSLGSGTRTSAGSANNKAELL